MHRIGVLVQEPTVAGLEEIVKVVLRTAVGPAHASSIGDIHANLPAVVFTESPQEVTVVCSELVSEVLGTGCDVVADILAVSTGCVATFVLGQLHETLFAITTDGVGIAGTLLESDGSQEDGRKSELLTKLLKGPGVRLAVTGERTALGDSDVEVHGNEITDVEGGRVPSIRVDTTVQPIDGTVGTSGLRDVLGGTIRTAPGNLNLDETASVGRIVIWLIILRGTLSSLGLTAVGAGVGFRAVFDRSLFASTGLIRTARDAIVVGTTGMVVQRRSLCKDGEGGEKNEG